MCYLVTFDSSVNIKNVLELYKREHQRILASVEDKNGQLFGKIQRQMSAKSVGRTLAALKCPQDTRCIGENNMDVNSTLFLVS